MCASGWGVGLCRLVKAREWDCKAVLSILKKRSRTIYLPRSVLGVCAHSQGAGTMGQAAKACFGRAFGKVLEMLRIRFSAYKIKDWYFWILRIWLRIKFSCIMFTSRFRYMLCERRSTDLLAGRINYFHFELCFLFYTQLSLVHRTLGKRKRVVCV